jgi:hypothetical protein
MGSFERRVASRRAREVVLAITFAAAAYLLVNRSPKAVMIALAAHYLGLLTLFSFLTVGEFFHILACVAWRQRRREELARILNAWRILTEQMPASAGILILASGLRLSGSLGLSPQQYGWLFYLAGGFAALATDGATGYTESVLRLWNAMQQARSQGDEELRRILRQPSYHLLFLIHFLAFFVLFWVGYRKPKVPVPLAGFLGWIESVWRTVVGSLAPALTTTTLVVAVSLVVLVGRWIGRILRHVLGEKGRGDEGSGAERD